MHSELLRWFADSAERLSELNVRVEGGQLDVGDLRFDKAALELSGKFEQTAKNATLAAVFDLWREVVGPSREFLLVRSRFEGGEEKRLRQLGHYSPPLSMLTIDHQIVGLALALQSRARRERTYLDLERTHRIVVDKAVGEERASPRPSPDLVAFLHELRVLFVCDPTISSADCVECKRLLRKKLSGARDATRNKTDGRFKRDALLKLINGLVRGLTEKRISAAIVAAGKRKDGSTLVI